MRSRITLLLIAIATLNAAAQDIAGTVRGRKADGSITVPYGNVYWVDTAISVTADGEGKFTIAPIQWPGQLVASASGYSNDTLTIVEAPSEVVAFVLEPVVELGAARIVERTQGTLLDTRSTVNMERIGQKELKRAACCDLSESFETNATVDVSYADAVSGTKAIKMLGLDGKYALISVENIPFLRGLSSSYGLTLLPGPWIRGINVSKGTGPVVNGYSSMTGQIDLSLLQPSSAEPLFVNLYGNAQGRYEANVHSAQRLDSAWHNLLMVHANFNETELDNNKDGFLDNVLNNRINILDRVEYQGDGSDAHFGVRYVLDDRRGGQVSRDEDVGPAIPRYQVGISNELVDVFAKGGFVFKNNPTRSIGLIGNFRQHTLDAQFGNRIHMGLEHSGSFSAIFQQLLRDGNDQVKAGLTFNYADFTEHYIDSTFGRTERIPGAFAEHTLKRGNFTAVSGLRFDMNDHYGNFLSPRLHLKYDLGPLTALRASGGSGWRSANPYVENASALASSRTVIVEESLNAERSWNVGVALTHKFKWMQRKWAFNVDAYRTEFTDQMVADMDASAHELRLYNLRGASYATTVQADLQVELVRPLQLKVAYRWYDARTTYSGQLLSRPFVPEHRAMADLAFTSPNEKWRFDITLNWFGTSRLPDLSDNASAHHFGERAPDYTLLHAQLSRVFGPLELYLGCENITDFMQHPQIIAPEQPFGPDFDASIIWGPTNGRMFYGGLRYTLKKKNK
ncbi:MAG: TonB-dependent receptor [Flavobacteriales bacterium]|nr:TonB-dependent receptor [Flavobacteriales bacterium]